MIDDQMCPLSRSRTFLEKRSLIMFKLSALIGSLAFFGTSWFSGFTMPRFVNGPGDYLIMPLFSFIMIIVAAQVAVKILPEKQQ